MFGKNMIYYKIEKKRKKSARSSIGLERLTTDQEVRGSTPLGRTKLILDYLITLFIADTSFFDEGETIEEK